MQGHISGEPKIANLNGTILVDEKICWLDVPMHNVGRVHKINRAERVIHDGDDVVL